MKILIMNLNFLNMNIMRIQDDEFKETRSDTGKFTIKCLGLLLIGVIIVALWLLMFGVL
jgi:hypothetical protein